ncbi:MAG: hypothetical protein RIT45_3020 [Pseudomonadota bacterium]
MSPPETTTRPWTPVETTEDLLAQIDDALAAGIDRAEVIAALVREGLEAETAGWAVDDVVAAQGTDAGTGADVAPPTSVDDAGGPLALSLWRVRIALRSESDPMQLPPERADALRRAFVRGGLRESAASALVDEALRLERALRTAFRARLRRLGMQGMVVSGLGTALFVLGGFAGGAMRWHWFSAVFTGAFFLYALALWRRNPPED